MTSAIDLPVCISKSQDVTRDANYDNLTAWKNVCNHRTIKCPMKRPQRYSTLQKSISGYRPQVGSGRVALIDIAVRTSANGHVRNIMVSFTKTYVLPSLMTMNNGCFQKPRDHQSIFKQTMNHASHLQWRMQLAENQDNPRNVYSITKATPE